MAVHKKIGRGIKRGAKRVGRPLRKAGFRGRTKRKLRAIRRGIRRVNPIRAIRKVAKTLRKRTGVRTRRRPRR